MKVKAALKVVLVMVIMVLCTILSNCSQTNVKGGEDYQYRSYKHIELHLLKLSKQVQELHRQLDWFLFDLDEEDPYNY